MSAPQEKQHAKAQRRKGAKHAVLFLVTPLFPDGPAVTWINSRQSKDQPVSSSGTKQSLSKLVPRKPHVPLLVFLSATTLIVAYFLPVMVVSKFVFFSDDVTLLGSVAGMWDEEYYVLATVIFMFSVIFPLAKLITLTMVWYLRFTENARARWLHWLGLLGKWSMLDVFVVATLIVLTQSKALLDAEPREGLYIFSIAIILSMLATVMVERFAKRVGFPTN